MRKAVLVGLALLLSCGKEAPLTEEALQKKLYVQVNNSSVIALGASLDQFQYACVDSLVVNTDDSKVIKVHADEEQGIRRMRSLVEESQLEEAWLYLPDSLLWIEVGKNSLKQTKNAGKYGRSVTFNEVLLKDIRKRNERIIEYHIHPSLEELQGFSKKEASRFTNPGVDSLEEEIAKQTLIIAAIPNTTDMKGYCSMAKKFYASHPGGEISFKTVCRYGVTSFSFTDEGRQVLMGGGKVFAAIEYPQTFISNVLIKGMPSVVEYIGKMSTQHTTIVFQPFPEFGGLKGHVLLGDPFHPEYDGLYQKLFTNGK
jgi:hypothetical protein